MLYRDPSGYNAATYVTGATISQISAVTLSGSALLASVKAFVAFIWNVLIVVGILITVLVAVVAICKTIGNVYSKIENAVKAETLEFKKYSRKICVYVLARIEHRIDSIFYVGRTANITARYNRHKATKGEFFMYVVYVCRSLPESRIVEQSVLTGCLVGQFTDIVFGKKPSNVIRGISRKQAANVIEQLGNELDETLSLLSCTSESDLLLMMNQ